MTPLALSVPLAALLLSSPPAAAGERPVAVHGHRGARAVLPENTWPAFEHAIEVGADILELDVVVTKDDALIITHNPEVDPALCVGPGGEALEEGVAVRERYLAELKQLDCGATANPRFPDQRPVPGTAMPTLDELFAAVAASELPGAATVRFNVEAKIVPGLPELAPTPQAFAALLVDCFRRYGVTERVILQSFDYRVLAAARAIEPALTVAFLNDWDHPDLAAIGPHLGVDIYAPNHLWITAEDVQALHAAGLEVHPWTVNEPEHWERLIEMGVDGIITDDPAVLIRYLEEREAGGGP
jgi:glycerophosphoryl diester phosphodiesterase